MSGPSENWKTRKINGYVADYQFKDIDNDGQNEIVLASFEFPRSHASESQRFCRL
jgi:hypothetical protein